MLFRKFHQQSGPDAMNTPRVIMDETPPPVKSYPRFDQILLPAPSAALNISLSTALARRNTSRSYSTTKSISIQEVSDVLFAGLGNAGIHIGNNANNPLSRHYPSGGGLFPIECYLAPIRVDGLDPDHCYHFDPIAHRLERFPWQGGGPAILESTKGMIPDQSPAAILILTAVWNRSYPKYGDFAYRIGLFEAGHIAQNCALASAGLSLSSGTMTGFNADGIAQALHIASDVEDPLYLFFFGK